MNTVRSTIISILGTDQFGNPSFTYRDMDGDLRVGLVVGEGDYGPSLPNSFFVELADMVDQLLVVLSEDGSEIKFMMPAEGSLCDGYVHSLVMTMFHQANTQRQILAGIHHYQRSVMAKALAA